MEFLPSLPSVTFAVLTVDQSLCTYQLKSRPPTPRPIPGQGGGMWGIFMVFEGTIRPWRWGISQDLLCTFIEVGTQGTILSAQVIIKIQILLVLKAKQ